MSIILCCVVCCNHSSAKKKEFIPETIASSHKSSQLSQCKGSGGNKKLLRRRIYTVGIVGKVPIPYGIDSMNHPNPNPTGGRPSEIVGQGRLSWILFNSFTPIWVLAGTKTSRPVGFLQKE